MKKYRIGKLAQEVGVTPDLLKHYEKYDIFAPIVDENNKYRYYDIYDAGRYISTRTYRNIGFSIQETKDMLNNRSLAEITAALADKAEEYERLIQEMERRLASVRKLSAQALRSYEDNEKWWICEREPYYFFQHTWGNQFIEHQKNKDIVPVWMDLLPTAERIVRINQGYLMGTEEYHFDYGIQLEAREAKAMGVDVSSPIQYVPAGRFFVFSQRVLWEQRDWKETMKEPLSIIRKESFKINGDAICQMPFVAKEENELVQYRIIWIPIE